MFPNIVKAGLMFGGSDGECVLIKDGKVANHYNSVSESWGLQIGGQSYSEVVFLMTDKAINYPDKSKGCEIGTGPSMVAVNEGVAKNLVT